MNIFNSILGWMPAGTGPASHARVVRRLAHSPAALTLTLLGTLHFGLTPVEAETVSGRVTAGGVGVPNVTVTLISLPNQNFGWVLPTLTDANGNWSANTCDCLGGARENYRVTFSGGGVDGFFPDAYDTVAVTADNVPNLNAEVRRGPVSGRATEGTLGIPNVFVLAERLFEFHRAPNLAIPDNGAAVSDSQALTGPNITTIRVWLSITHTFIGDLDATLIHPDGTRVRLHSRSGVGTDNLNQIYPDTASTADSLNVLVGKSMNGTWRMEVKDSAANDVGFFNGWGMILSGSQTSVTTDANGNYTLTNMTYGSVLTPTKGGVTFSPATVITKSPAAANLSAVPVAPTISDIPNTTIQEDSGPRTLDFTVGDNAIPAANLTVTATVTGGGTNLIPQGNISLGGSGANRSITVTPVSNANGTAVIQVTVSDGASSTSDSFTLTVNPVNDPPTVSAPATLTISEDSNATINITVGDIDTPVDNLVLSATSFDQNLIMDAALVPGGSGANRTLRLTPRPNANGTADIQLIISDGQFNLPHNVRLTVTPANDQPVAGPLTGVRLDGLDEYVSTPSVGSGLSGNASHTLEMWVRPDPIYAGVFASDFESGTPAGMTVSIDASVSGGYLRLTPALGGKYGVATIDNFGGTAPVDRFRASFKLALFGASGAPADGFSFNLVPAAAVSATPAAIAFEDGFPQGLAVNFDTWDNGAGEAPSVEVKWLGNVIARVPYQASSGGTVADPLLAARDVFINLDPDGTIDVQVDSQHLIQNVPTGYNPATIGTPRWVLGARTGGSFDNHWVDNLRIEAPSTSINNNARRVIATLGNLSGAGHYWLLNPGPDSTNALLECGIVNTRVLLSGLPIPANKWTHIAATWDSANATYTVYLDGQPAGQVAGGGANFNLAGVPLNLGQGFSGAANFRGNLDEVRLWSLALNPEIIADNRGYPLRGSESGLQVYHRFDETVGLTVTDSAAFRGNSDGVLVNGAAYGIPATVQAAGSLRFDGVNDEVIVPALPALGVGNVSHTIEAWIKPAPMQIGERSWPLVLGQGGGGAHHWLLNRTASTPANRVVVQLGIWSGVQLEGPTLEVNTWQHLAATWNAANNTLIIYTNGVQAGQLIASAVQANNFTTNLLTLGQARPGGSGVERWFAGALDEVRVWNRVLTPAEVATYRNSSPLGNEPGLIAYLRLDEGAGPIVADGAGGDNLGTIVGNPTWTEPAPTLAGLVATSTNASTGFGIVLVNEDVPERIFLPAFDVEQFRVEGSLNFTVINLPQNGTLVPTSGVWSNATQNPVLYTPLTNYTGPDSFTFRVTDSSGQVSGVYTVPVLVQSTNDPPTIGAIRDLIIEENTSSEPITFTVADNDTSLENLIFTPLSSDNTIIKSADIQITGSGPVRTLIIRPVTNEVGAVTITIYVTDRITPTQQPAIFRVRVVPKPAYAIVNLGTLSGYAQSFGRAVNNLGWVAGMAQLPPSEAHAFLFKGIEGPSGLTDLGTLGGLIAEGNGLNDLNFVTGVSTASDGRRQAFRWANGVMTPLGFFGGGNYSEGRAINTAGLVAGAGAVGSVTNAFLYGGALTNLGTLAGGARSEAFALNEASEVAGYSTVAGGAEHAFLYRNGAMTDLGTLPGHGASRAHGLNNFGQLAGYSQANNGARTAVVFDRSANTNINLGTLPGGASSVANSINDFGQVVGQAGNAANGNSAFLYSANRLHDLNDIISSEDAELWRLQDARAINREGFIVGTGLLNGSGGGTRAFLALPAWVIGRPIPRPEGAVKMQPEIEVLSGPGNPGNSFFWSTVESRLYAIRPVTARLRWFIEEPGSGSPLNTNRIVTVGIAVWPRQPTLHVANTPTDIEPRNIGFPYNFQRVIYQQVDGVAVEPSTKQFTATTPGYSVLHYIRNNGATPRPDTHPPVFDVVRTVNWDDSRHLISSNWTVGTVIKHTTHFDYAGRNGFVYFPKTFIDSVGADRAYDRDSRLGAIIPVNAPTDQTSGENDPLVVVWYRLNGLGAAWSSTPVRYALNWPENAPRIVIASAKGSEPLDPLLFPDGRVYNQPVRALPGYNPNEEHALIRAANGKQVLFALRDDLNWKDAGRTQPKVSPPFSLFKHRDPLSGEWRIRAFQVIDQGIAYDGTNYGFTYPAVAGNELTAPMPLSTLTVCASSHGVPGAGPWWEDVKGKIYARAAGPEGGNTNILIRWSYPLQPGFSYDEDFDGVNDVPDGTCIAWLDRSRSQTADGTPGTPGTAINVTYNTRWPDNARVLQIGETLLDSRRDLPDVLNMAAVKIIYDDLNPTDDTPLSSLARFYDPVSARTVPLPAGFVWPPEIVRENLSGKEYFPGLPYALKQRLYHDPINKTLTFQGVLKLNFSLGQNPHLLLPNVISPREQARLLALAPANSAWATVVSNLFLLTRNPNGVDMDQTPGPDRELRLGLTTVDDVVVPEQFGDGPKALTAALADVPPPPARPGDALQFDTSTSAVDLGSGVSLGGTFTEEAWIYPQATVATNYHGILGHDPDGTAVRRAPSLWIHDLTRVAYGFGDGTAFREGETAPVLQSGAWNHVAATFDGGTYRIYVNGFLVRTDTNFAGRVPAATAVRYLGERAGRTASFAGRMDEVRLWNVARSGTEIAALMRKRLNGAESGLAGLWRCDEGSGSTLSDAGPQKRNGTLQAVSWVNLELQSPVPNWGLPPRYITLAENDDATLAGLPITLRVIRVDDGPYPGDLKLLPSDNVFDERVSMRHSSDFGGAPERLSFQWYYKPDEADFDNTDLPLIDPATGNLIPGQERGWTLFPVTGNGVNDITLGEGGESSLVTLGDNWFICRYRGYNVNGNTDWSNWIGQEEGRAQLAQGWIKRVLAGLNQFDARTDDFHSAPSSTFASMLIQAGERYEGPIAFNPDAANLNSLGLIEAYSTVFERARDLSIQGAPPVNFDAANNALLLVSSRISDLYMLLGNEAYADAQDPTIGFGTASGEYGGLASSIFTFQNQLDSLLEEELVLLRGLDDRGRSVRLAPIYNRLVWNFTLGEGEVAYRQTYNIGDQNFDGFINENDARILYPQGHGDAWGHYLTALKTYYFLMRHPNFTWKPRTEPVSVAGASVQVDFLDERKFARIAAAKARSGRDIVDLTYRNSYVEDPAGQWQGYKDTDATRAWGVDDWARRANQGAYLDWLAANAILPSTDPNPSHTGIQKIDRQTVSELAEIAAQALEVQTRLDQSDVGLNPVGIAKGSVPFDIDPTFLEVGSTAQIGRRAVQGLTQFDQILERAVKSVKNSMAVWDEANKATELIRRTQDSVDDFTQNVRDQEVDYKNRLIEIFGYPYAGDIGAGKTYRSGYDGPDLVHHMYISSRTVTGETAPPGPMYTGYFTGSATNGYVFSPTDEDYDPYTTDTAPVEVDYPLSSGGWAFDAPTAWGERRAPGELQLALSDLVQAENNLKLAIQNYDGVLYDIVAQAKLLKAERNLNSTNIVILNRQKNEAKRLDELILSAQRGEISARRISSVTTRAAEAVVESIPDSDSLSGFLGGIAKGIILGTSIAISESLETVGDVLAVEQTIQEQAKEQNDLQIAIDLQTVEQDFTLLQSIEELNHTVRDEISLRLELYNQSEVVRQTLGRYQARLAEGQRLLDELERFRKSTAAQITEHRYEDMTFRIFRNDALQKYRASFDIAARYVYLAANAYDYEINFLRTDQRSGSRFLTEIVRQRNLGQLLDGEPVVGQPGLCDLLGRMVANWEVLKPQFGVSAPQIADTRFSLREELFRIRGDVTDEDANESWRETLKKARVANLWDVPEFRRYCRPFAPELLGPQPAIVIRFPTTITFGLNYFGWPLAGGDSAYDPTQFSTKIARAGVWFSGSDGTQISQTPRIYLVPVGMDIQRSPTGDTLATREWRIVDQAVPPPFPIGASDLDSPGWIPGFDTLGGTFAQIRRYGSFGAKHDEGIYSEDDLTNDTRLIGRSAWNTEWMMIIPGGTLLFDPNQGLEKFISTVSDIKVYFQTYSYAGN